MSAANMVDAGHSIDMFFAQYMQKKAAKEYPPSNNPPGLQARLDEAKVTEWQILSAKDAARIVPPWQADKIRRDRPHRIMGTVVSS